MNFSEYQRQARTTAIYPESSQIVYPALGLASESGEVCGHVKKMVRDDTGIMSEEREQKLRKELGDVLWYIANLASDLDMNLSDIAQENLDKLFDRKDRGVLQGSGDLR